VVPKKKLRCGVFQLLLFLTEVRAILVTYIIVSRTGGVLQCAYHSLQRISDIITPLYEYVKKRRLEKQVKSPKHVGTGVGPRHEIVSYSPDLYE